MTFPPEPVGISNQPYYIRERKDFAIQQESYRHNQALYSLGEPAMFVLMWREEDFQYGYTSRCSRCFTGDIDGRVADVYHQSTQNKCPRCYGTTFEGGLRARIVRPAIFTDTDDEEKESAKGIIHPQRLRVETTNDFRYRSGDYVFRYDGSRWQLSTPSRVTLRTGYLHPSQPETSIGYGPSDASMEDATSVAFIIPPAGSDLKTILTPESRWPNPVNDLVNGPLIPQDWTD